MLPPALLGLKADGGVLPEGFLHFTGMSWDGITSWDPCQGQGEGSRTRDQSPASHALPLVAPLLGRGANGSVLFGRPELGHAPGPERRRRVPLHVL